MSIVRVQRSGAGTTVVLTRELAAGNDGEGGGALRSDDGG
jgi:hypothetical protein